MAPALVCAVVKADAYGHGAVAVAGAAIKGGAHWLAVAMVEEGLELRKSGISSPILLLSEPDPDAMDEAVAYDLIPTLYTHEGLNSIRRAARARSLPNAPTVVQLKVDTGMHRVGADPKEVLSLAQAVEDERLLALGGLWTHLAVADEPSGEPFTKEQIQRFQAVVDDLKSHGIVPPMLHVANSAGALAYPGSRYGMVRCGIAMYGYPPVPVQERFEPVMALKARVSYVHEVPAGEGVSYGLRWRAPVTTLVAVVPAGYADGVARKLGMTGGSVLIAGKRRPLAGTVTMDQIVVDCGAGSSVSRGEEVVLIGTQAGEQITAEEWAVKLDTISYEVLCGIGPRVPRVIVDSDDPSRAAPRTRACCGGSAHAGTPE